MKKQFTRNKEKFPYLTPSMEAVCIHTEGSVLTPSMGLPDVTEEDMDWTPMMSDIIL
ncbi:MAG: hypothetical protein J5669_05850 [Bacteroidales bacterium]|nr:hypothetical protein [Bacteroidales bacterium]